MVKSDVQRVLLFLATAAADSVPPSAVTYASKWQGSATHAPRIVQSGHDFVVLRWKPQDYGAPDDPDLLGYRVLSSYWTPSFVRHHAPDLTGVRCPMFEHGLA